MELNDKNKQCDTCFAFNGTGQLRIVLLLTKKYSLNVTYICRNV